MKCTFWVNGLDWDFFKEKDLLGYEVFRSARRGPVTSPAMGLERIHLALCSKLWNECVTAFIFQKYFMIGEGDRSADLAKQICYEIHTHLASLDSGKGALCIEMPGPSSGTEKLDWEEE